MSIIDGKRKEKTNSQPVEEQTGFSAYAQERVNAAKQAYGKSLIGDPGMAQYLRDQAKDVIDLDVINAGKAQYDADRKAYAQKNVSGNFMGVGMQTGAIQQNLDKPANREGWDGLRDNYTYNMDDTTLNRFYAMYGEDKDKAINYANEYNKLKAQMGAMERQEQYEKTLRDLGLVNDDLGEGFNNVSRGVAKTMASIGATAFSPYDIAKGAYDLAAGGGRFSEEFIQGNETPFTAMKTDFQRDVKQAIDEATTLEFGDNKVTQFLGLNGEKVMSNLYSIGYSTLESAVIAGIGGGAGTVLLGTSAGMQTLLQQLQAGVSSEKALAQGLIAGLTEWATERYITLEKVLKAKNMRGLEGKAAVKQYLVNQLKAAGAEGSEEFFGSVIDTIADVLINQDDSEISRLKAEYLAAGEDNPLGRAILDKIGEAASEGLSGAISGLLMSAGGTAVQNAAANATYSRSIAEAQKSGTYQDLLDSINATEYMEGREALTDKTDVKDVRRAYRASAETIETAAIKERLESQGVPVEDSQRYAEIIFDMGNDYATKRSDRNSLSPEAQKVAEEYEKGEANWVRDAKAFQYYYSTNETPQQGVTPQGVEVEKQIHAEERREEVAEITGENVKTESNADIKVTPEDVFQSASNAVGISREIISDAYAKRSDEISAERYANAAELAFRYGAAGEKLADVVRNIGFSMDYALSEAYKNGQEAYVKGLQNNKLRIDRKTANVSYISREEATKMGVDTVDIASMSKDQRAYVDALDTVAKAYGVKMVLFESSGNVNVENGHYDPTTNSIYIDVSSTSGLRKYAILSTAAHELVHDFRRTAPEVYDALRQFVIDKYYQGSETAFDEAAKRIKKQRKLQGFELESEDAAVEELVAMSCEKVFDDANMISRFAETLESKTTPDGQTMLDKFVEWLNGLIERLKSALAELTGIKANQYAEMMSTKDLEHLRDLFVQAAREIQSTDDGGLSESGIEYDTATDTAMMSTKDIPQNEEEIALAVERLSQKLGVTKAEAREWVESELSTASLILDPKFSDVLEYRGDRRYTAIKKNSDYPQGTLDFSNICRKRRNYTAMMQRLQKRYPNRVFTAEELAEIRQILVDNDIQVACGLCFVEDRRQNETGIAKTFQDAMTSWFAGERDGFNKYQTKALQMLNGGEEIPSIYELTTLEGMQELRAKAPNVADAWEKFNNARGMQSARLLQGEAEYKRQILKYNAARVKRINDLGGLRIFSFSDFEEFHLIDIIQAIQDCAAMGLKIQGYTKVPSFAKLVMDTGTKVNRSLIPKGDLGYRVENGKPMLEYDTTEGIDINDPDFFDSTDNPNIGNILVGINDEQIAAAFLDPFVDYIIPFHTGQRSDVLRIKKLGAWKNYKDYQEDKPLPGTTRKKGINIYTEVLNAAEKEGKPITNERQFVEKFLEVCKREGMRPRFSQFLNTDENGNYVYRKGYYKVLLDFKLFDKDGNILPQNPVKPIFDNEYINSILTGYAETKATEEKALAPKMERAYAEIENKLMHSTKEDAIDLTYDPEIDKYIKKANGQFTRGLQNYIFDIFKGKEILFNNGIRAIVKNSDAQHLARESSPMKQAELSNVRDIIRYAQYVGETDHVKTKLNRKGETVEDKFDYYYYYKTKVKYKKLEYYVYLNVGRDRTTHENRFYELNHWDSDEKLKASGGLITMSYPNNRTPSGENIILPIGEVVNSEIENSYDYGVKHSVKETDPRTLKFLNDQIKKGEYFVTFRAMQKIGDGLYSPMNADEESEGGKPALGFKSTLGEWERSTEDPSKVNDKGQYPLKPGKYGTSKSRTIWAAYNPYMHSSNSVLNDQFEAAYDRDNLVVVKCYVPKSEVGGAYRAEKALDATGWKDWKAGTVASKLAKAKKDFQRKVFLSRWIMPVEIVSDSEVAKMYKKYLEGTDVKIPFNVVPPHLLKALEKANVPIDYNGTNGYQRTHKNDVKLSTKDSDGRTLTPEQQEYFKDSKVRDENGNLLVVYHGSHRLFTKFSGGVVGNFFARKFDVATGYAGNLSKDGIWNPAKAQSFETLNEYLDSVGVGLEHKNNKYIITEYDGETTTFGTLKEVTDYVTDQYLKFDLDNAAVYQVYLNITNPFVLDAKGKEWNNLPKNASGETDTEMVADWARKQGYDGVVFKNIIDGWAPDDVYVTFDANQQKDVENKNPTSNPDIRYSTKDSEYMELAKNPEKNKAKLQAMVDEAAKAAFPNSKLIQDGKFRKMWHFTEAQFNEFKPGRSADPNGIKGMYFAPTNNGNISSKFGDGKQYYLNVTNPKVPGAKEHNKYADQLRKMQKGVADEEIADINRQFVEETGVDGFVDWMNGWYTVLTPEQIKSADPVTYDDNGNVIPLSERFNESSNDIRYSTKDEDEIPYGGKAYLTPERVDMYLKDFAIPDMPNRSQAWIARISPRDFWRATSDVNTYLWLKDDTRPLDVSRLKEQRQPIFLDVELNEDGVPKAITGHEGRHRSLAMDREGIYREPVILFDYGHWANDRSEYSSLMLRGQGNSPLDYFVNVNDVIPLDYAHRDAIVEKFATPTKEDQLRERYGIRKTLQYSLKEDLSPNEYLASAVLDNIRKPDDRAGLEEYLNRHKELYQETTKLSNEITDLENKLHDSAVLSDSDRESIENRIKTLRKDVRENEKKMWDIVSKPRMQRIIEQQRATIQEYEEEMAKAEEKSEGKIAELRARMDTKVRAEIDKRIAMRKRMLEQQRTQKSRYYYLPRIEKVSKELRKNLEKAPMPFREPIADFLAALDTRTLDAQGNVKENKANARKTNLIAALNNMSRIAGTTEEWLNKYNVDFNPEMVTWIDEMVEYLSSNRRLLDYYGDINLNTLSADMLEGVYKMVRSLNTTLKNLTKSYTNKALDISEEATAVMEYDSKFDHGSERTNMLENLFRWKNAQATTVYKRMGDAGWKMYKLLVKGQSKLAFNEQEIVDFAQSHWKPSDIRKWNDPKKAVAVEIGDEKVMMTPAQMMALYATSRDADGLRHLVEGGGFKLTSQAKDKRTVVDESRVMTEMDLANVVNALNKYDPKLIKLTEEIQDFIGEQGAKWGNEVSVARFGYEQFGIENYFPLHTVAADFVGNVIQEDTEAGRFYSMLNRSFTKERVFNANNALVIDGIFDIFANHMSQMALYNAYALPVLDTARFMNWKINESVDGKPQVTTLGDVWDKAFGKGEMQRYLTNLLDSIAGTKRMDAFEAFALAGLRLHNRVAVAANIRVAVQQPFSITRAFDEIDPKYFTAFKNLKALQEEMWRWSGIALWKHQGNYDTNIKGSLTSQVMGAKTAYGQFVNNVSEKAMWLAEQGDDFTWAAIWNACKNFISATQPNLTGDAYMEAVTSKFEDVILLTQVVDTPLQKSDWMRQKSFLYKMTSSFKAEPTTSYNMLLRQYDRFLEAKQKGTLKQEWSSLRGPMLRAIGTFALTTVVNALVTAVIDAFRDDDDYETWLEKLKYALLGDYRNKEGWAVIKEFLGSNIGDSANILASLPWLADMFEILEGYDAKRVDLEILSSALNSAKSVWSTLTSGDWSSNLYKKIFNLVNAASKLSGLPVANMMRDVVSVWNTVFARIDSSMKLQQTPETKQSGYNAFYDALRNGETVKAMQIVDEIYSNEISSKTAYTGVTNIIRKAYQDGKIDKEDALDYMLMTNDYFDRGFDRAHIKNQVDGWKQE